MWIWKLLSCLVEFFKSRFEETGKSIDHDASEMIATLVDNHPYYAQQLAQQCWLRTSRICTTEIVEAALIKNDILDNIAGALYFQDPIYAYWLKTEYFRL